MAVLHLIFSAKGLQSCLEIADSEDAVLLIENGVYAVLDGHGRSLYAIADDLMSRGVQNRDTENIKLIGYDDMVELATRHQPIVSWH